MELNTVEKNLKKIYDDWKLGNEKENNGYSAMFRMGFPDEYIDSDRPLLMYVGQEDLNGNSYKTQEWVRKYQMVQCAENNDILPEENVRRSPFWDFYRKFGDMGYNSLWNNLDKFLYADHKTHLSSDDATSLSAAYGLERLSVLQREIKLLKPSVIMLVIGPRKKYRVSLASAFSVNEKALTKYKPTIKNCVNDVSDILGLKNTIALWTYHPNYLRRRGLENIALNEIKQLIDTSVSDQYT